MKIWYIKTMKYHSAVKKNKIMNFAGQWKELDKIIQSEVSQTRKANVASVIRGS